MLHRHDPSSRRRGLRFHIGELLRALATPLWVEAAATDVPLHRCAQCNSDAVWPVEWDDVDGGSWKIELRCGECGHHRTTVAADREAVAFDARLGEQFDRMRAVADLLDRERMADEADRFADALAHDLIDAADFAR